MTQEDRKKTSLMQEELKGFFASTNVICSDIVLWRDLVVYLTYWLGEAIFAGGDGTHIRSHCIFLACQMAFGEQLALVPALNPICVLNYRLLLSWFG